MRSILLTPLLLLSTRMLAQSFDGYGSGAVVICADSTLRAWGNNEEGTLGNGTTISSTTPVVVLEMSEVVAVAGGHNHLIALRADGSVWDWGYGASGQLGTGSFGISSSLPVPVTPVFNGGVRAIAGGAWHSMALRDNGTVWCWGNNTLGQLGNGTNVWSNVPVEIAEADFPIPVRAIACGGGHSLALLANRTVRAWGSNAGGTLGNGTTINSNTPVEPIGLNSISRIGCGNSFSLAVRDDGTLWTWGANYDGQLGNGTTTAQLVPMQVATEVRSAAAGDDHMLILRNDGTVLACGNNASGQLGDGTNVTSSVPVPVLGLTDVVAVASNKFTSYALKSDGTVWSWGENYYGEMGIGTTTNSSLAVQISGLCTVAVGLQPTPRMPGLVIAPNPATAQVRISGMEHGDLLRVLDITGREIQQPVASANELVLDVAFWPRGCYIVSLERADGVRRQKLILE